jgi:hypothetical protein
MKTNRILGTALAALLGLAATAGAAEGNRFLLVFETAKGMKRNLDAARLCAKDLLTSDFGGQAAPGDTLGVWTYDSELHTGAFPMQELATGDETAAAQRLDDFLKQQRCAGNARFDQVLAGLNRVVAESGGLTVLVFSDGYDPMVGTPFDASVNDIYAQHRAELRDAHIPFVTLLQSRNGKIVRGTVNSAVGPIEIPALPPPPAPPKPAVEPAPAPEPVAVVKTNPPLILDFSQAAARSNLAAAANSPKRDAGNAAPAAKSNDTSSPGLLAATLSTITNLMNLGTPAPPPKPPASPVTSAPAAANPPAESTPATPVAAATPAAQTPPAPTPPARGGFILAGLGLLLALAGLAVLGLWRMRSAPKASVITESFNRPKK